MKTQVLNAQEFTALWQKSKIVSQHGVYGPKVFVTPEGDYVKVFNPKKGVTKRRWFPKHLAFIRNIERLKRFDIETVHLKLIYYLSDTKSYAVRYAPLPGQDVRALVENGNEKVMPDFIDFLVNLHQKGIYFRGLHLGNVLKLPNGKFGLIDTADLYFKRAPLNIIHRVRNLAHMIKTKPDTPFFTSYGIERFLNEYSTAAKIFDIRRWWFNLWCRVYISLQ